MKKQKRELLNNTFNSFIEVGLSGENLEILEDIVFKDVVGFGTTVDEKLSGVKELRDLLIRQKEQSAGMGLSWKINTLDLYISSDENTAISTNEITLYLIVDDNPIEIYLRFSIVMEYADDKWMVVHWHGSKPEHVESEKDTWGVQSWKEKAEELENLVAERTADLVVKNRELEIEAALERIRAQAVAMRESSDLLDIVVTMRKEFIKLGHEAHYFWHMMWLSETYEKAMTSGDGTKIGFVMQLPRHIHGNIPQLAKWEKSKKPTVVYTMTVDEAIDYVDKMVSLGDFKNIDPQAPSHDDIRHIGGLTFIMARTTHGEIGYSLPGVVENPPKADIDILVKFASAFDLAHQRFLDLQKAEKQARETQIELALEKIRSRSMAMHKSDELKEIILVVYEQLVQLQVKVEHAGFIIDYKEHEDMHIWLADRNSVFPKIVLPYFDCAHWNDFVEAKKTGQNFFTNQLGFEEKNKFYKDVFQYIPNLPEEIKATYFEFEGLAISTVLLDNVGLYIENYEGVPFSDEENAILMRFGKVFQQAYTRFLDLQKAEAQARETQIQLALERVRVKTMAMKTQSDLLGIVELFGQQLSDLNVRFTDVTFIEGAITKDRDWELWSHIPGADNLTRKIHIPYVDTPYFTKTAIAVEEYEKTGNPIQTKFFTKEEKDEFLDHYWKYAPAVPEKVRELVYANPGSTIVDAFLENVTVSIVRSDLEPFTEEELSIFERFSKEFKQTYTRYLDIKKAEEQAKESKIEAALEKVRSRSLAMHRSDELKEVVSVLFENLKELQIPFTAVGIATNIEGSKDLNAFVCGQNETGLVITNYRLPYFDNPVSKDVYGAIEKQLDYFVGHYSKEEKDAFYEYVIEHTDEFRHLPEDIKRMIFDSTSYTISMVAVKNAVFNINDFDGKVLAENEIDIIKRFAKVFEQAYIRFLDLQKAEAQTREAQIEAALEKVRSRTLAMQKSDELAETSVVVFKELLKLGIESNRLFIGIVKDNAEAIDAWATNEDGSKIEQHFTLYTSKNKSIKKMVEGWKQQKKSAIIDMEGEELTAYFHYLNKVMHIPFIDGLKQKRRVQSIAYFSGGLIGMASPQEQPKDTINLLERFAAVFNLTYARFKDLKVAEAQARQAEVDLINLQKAKKNAEEALAELQTTQKQLIQQEKLASLGQLTAGIAHEIKNPLNFVNNFSEVSIELIDEALEEINQIKNNPHAAESAEILSDIQANLTKIHEHGSRADSIVKSMLMHSRGGSGKMELADLNALIKEYVNLAFHGMRAGKNPISVDIDLQLHEQINKILLVEEDFSRVLLNLCNNAFDAMRERLNANEQLPNSKKYQPKLRVRTLSENGKVSIEIEDNGPGIPDDIKDKILQPFFTTKKGTEGTGLGLSITDDIIKAHGGILSIKSEIGKGSTFIIALEKNR